MKKSIVILTGAGISAESGIKTFRDHSGLWENHRIEEVATPEAFEANPILVQKFYNDRRTQLLSPEVKPNAAHYALAELESGWSGDFLLVTQNVDNLHERAGSKSLVHMYGELPFLTQEIWRTLETCTAFAVGTSARSIRPRLREGQAVRRRPASSIRRESSSRRRSRACSSRWLSIC